MAGITTSLLIVVALVLGFAGGYTLSDDRGAQNRYMGGVGMPGAGIDRHFIEQMIPHHEGAIEMAKIALERSKRPEIVSLANGIVEAQERENTNMRAWYGAWFGSAPSVHGMGMMHMGSMEGDVDVLTSVPEADFDREFIEQMIPHHEMAIMMAQMLAASTERLEMQELADAIITSQSREIDMMRGWLETWY